VSIGRAPGYGYCAGSPETGAPTRFARCGNRAATRDRYRIAHAIPGLERCRLVDKHSREVPATYKITDAADYR
jgi:hypothetical protein